ncbi:hypothetical protein AX016_1220 [Cellulophaga sp. RHA19]|uniref:hypothetical protein n=1 Tax=Cellulophaga sp. RHA19 TaxID=1798237 RepID=UPI000C2CCEC0|nr:hypothetical protein [Cellulophaga sp. RHA19]PKB43038.1 hypothetical protein AX016_1220 [Cellulophaga sp. RHA19]
MRIFLKILAFILLITLTSICGWKFGREIKKSDKFGDEYIGYNKKDIISEFGKPDILSQKLASEFNDNFKFFYESVNCNPNTKVTYIKYEKAWYDYEFWLLNKNNLETVILVK